PRPRVPERLRATPEGCRPSARAGRPPNRHHVGAIPICARALEGSAPHEPAPEYETREGKLSRRRKRAESKHRDGGLGHDNLSSTAAVAPRIWSRSASEDRKS